MGLFKYLDRGLVQPGENGQNLYFGRAAVDGVPFRGRRPPLLKEDEFQDLTQRVCDAKVKKFNVSDPQELEELQEVLDKAANQWYQVLHMETQWCEAKETWFVLLMWAQWYQQLSPDKERLGTYTVGSS